MENESSVVWNELNQFVGSREVVFMRQTVYNYFSDIHSFNAIFKDIPSGSQAEGLNLPGSDYDFMRVLKTITVKPKQCNDTPNADLIIETDNIKPGFCKLYLSSGQTGLEKLDRYAAALTPINERLYLSSVVFRDIVVEDSKGFNYDAEPHGPCVSFKCHQYCHEFDDMMCMSSKYWPAESNEWLHRQRVNNWPAPDLVSNIVDEGVLIVPIGNPLSEESHIEWRISYSLAEKKLIHSMNQAQILCYALLKLYLKHVIESREDCKGLLCSYFLKTALFFCIEEENIVWDKTNFLKCFWTCFKRLFLWIREGYCPNYFTKTNNMFESKIFGEKQRKLQEYCFRFYENRMETICEIPILSNLYAVIISGTLGYIPYREYELKTKEYEFEKEFLVLFEILPGKYIDAHKVERLLYCRDLLPFKRVCMLYHLRLCQIDFTQKLYHYIINSDLSNKSKYKQLQILSRYILNSCTHFDICTGWLQFATLCFLTGHYCKVVSTVEYVLKQFKPFVLYNGSSYLFYYGTEYMDHMCGKGFTIEYKHKTALANAYMCLPNLGFYPSEIDSEIQSNCIRIRTYQSLIFHQGYTVMLWYFWHTTKWEKVLYETRH